MERPAAREGRRATHQTAKVSVGEGVGSEGSTTLFFALSPISSVACGRRAWISHMLGCVCKPGAAPNPSFPRKRESTAPALGSHQCRGDIESHGWSWTLPKALQTPPGYLGCNV